MPRNQVKVWREPALDGTLFLQANYHEQRFDRHYHEEYAIGVTDSGCQAFIYDGHIRLDMPAGTVALIAPGIVHIGWPGAAEGWRYRMFYPGAELVRRAAAEMFATTAEAFDSPVAADDTLSQLLARLHSVSGNGQADRLEVERLFFAVVRRSFGRHAGKAARDEAPRIAPHRAAAMRDMIEARHDTGLTLDELAGVSGLSRFEALRHFRATYGVPPHVYLRQVRVRAAHHSILRGTALATAASVSGFADQAHMTRDFRRIVGYTPGALARAC